MECCTGRSSCGRSEYRAQDGAGREDKVRWFPIVLIVAALTVMPSILAGPAHAGDPASKYDLQKRVAEAGRMLAVNPRLKGMSDAQRERLTEFVAGQSAVRARP